LKLDVIQVHSIPVGDSDLRLEGREIETGGQITFNSRSF